MFVGAAAVAGSAGWSSELHKEVADKRGEDEGEEGKLKRRRRRKV